MTHEFYKKYRPRNLKQVIGQPDAVKTLEGFIQKNALPHALLFTGGSGTGKTTLARILKKHLDCHEQDYNEINASSSRGIDTVREINTNLSLSPVGKCRIWYFDEAHKLTGDAQNALLKMLEDTPSHVYFMLATTDSQKLIKTIHTRCTEVRLVSLQPKHLKEVISRVLEKESLKLSEDVIDKVIEAADGSARKALVILEQIALLASEEEQLDAVLKTDTRRQAIEIARALLNPKTQWSDMAKILKGVEDEPETIRHIMLTYMSSVLLGGKANDRAYDILCAFEKPFYETKRAGLVMACYEVLRGGK